MLKMLQLIISKWQDIMYSMQSIYVFGQNKLASQKSCSNFITYEYYYKQLLQTQQKIRRQQIAYCFNQKILICIQCILQDGHKSHQMNSINKSYEVQIDAFRKKIQKLQIYLNLVKQKSEENTKIQTQYFKNYQNTCEVVKSAFLEIKQLIQEQQIALIDEIECTFRSIDEKFIQKDKIYLQKMLQIQEILCQVQNSSSLSEIQFLKEINHKQQTINSIKLNSYQNLKMIPFNHSKNSIFQNFIKVLNTSKTNLKNNSIGPNTNANNIIPVNIPPSKNQKGIFNQPLRGFRKAAFSNLNTCQNNKSQKKVSSRKQSISHHVQPSTLKVIDKDKVLKPSNNNIKQTTLTLQQQLGLNIKHEKPQKPQKAQKGQKKSIKKIGIIQNISTIELSCVDHKQSLCSSFLSGVSTFINQKKNVYILGGFNQQNDNIMRLDLNTMNYEQIVKLNSNRSKFGTAIIDKKIYIVGGKKGKERLNDIQMYDIQTQTWSKVGVMNKNRSGFGLTSIEDEIFIIGGNDGESILNTVETFNVKTKEWKKLPPLNQARDQLAVVIGNDDRIYAIGGFGGINNEPLRTVQVYDFRLKQWKNIQKMKYARRALSGAVLADGIYAIGGFDGASYMSSVERYDYINDEWMQIAGMNVARCTHSSIAVYQTQQIYVFGGFDFLPLHSVQKYSLIANQWQTVSQMPSARFMHSCLLTKK